jgi:ribosomal protein S14
MTTEETRCIDCGGNHGVELRWPGYGHRGYARCEACGEKRVEREMVNRQRYGGESDIGPPSDFDPADAGESWSNDY